MYILVFIIYFINYILVNSIFVFFTSHQLEIIIISCEETGEKAISFKLKKNLKSSYFVGVYIYSRRTYIFHYSTHFSILKECS